MGSLGIDGLVSGLNTTDLINSLMSLEAAPQAALKTKQSALQSTVTALQGLNVRVQSVQTSAAKAADPANWNAMTATASSKSVAVSTTSAAQAGTLNFTVGAVATRQVSLSAAVTDGSQLAADNPPTFTVQNADGTMVSVTAQSNSLGDIAHAINDSDLGITATAVRVSGGDTPSYRLQFTSQSTGTDGSFELYVGTEADVVAGTATRLDSDVATSAKDASVVLWKDTPYEQTVTQSSNTFDSLLDGLSVTLGANSEVGEDVTVTVATDATKVNALASDMVNALSVVISEIASRSSTTTTTGADGRTVITGGLFTGDSSVRNILDQLTNAAVYPVDGRSPASIGIDISRTGEVSFNKDTFAAAMADDPEGVAALVQGIASRLEGAAKTISDSRDGTLTTTIATNQDMVKSYGSQIENWDLRLETRRATLQATYSALEVTLGNLQSQSTWLAGQLASLPGMSSGRS